MSREVEVTLELAQAVQHPVQGLAFYHLSGHGQAHALRVARLAFELAQEANQEYAICVAAYVGGYLHDCGRKTDEPLEPHGQCGAQTADHVMLGLVMGGYLNIHLAEKVKYAVLYHSAAVTDADPLVAAIWDADRLDTHGEQVRQDLLSSEAAKARVGCPV